MALPQGFYELARARDTDLRSFDRMTAAPAWPVFLRIVPVRESTAEHGCSEIGLPCGAEAWFHHYPREVLYVGPLVNNQVPLALAITHAAVAAQWPLAPICSTWGSGGGCQEDHWLLPHTVVPIAPPDLFPWPYEIARWTRTREARPPIQHRLVPAAGGPNLFALRPARPQEIAYRD